MAAANRGLPLPVIANRSTARGMEKSISENSFEFFASRFFVPAQMADPEGVHKLSRFPFFRFTEK